VCNIGTRSEPVFGEDPDSGTDSRDPALGGRRASLKAILTDQLPMTPVAKRVMERRADKQQMPRFDEIQATCRFEQDRIASSRTAGWLSVRIRDVWPD
jgi:hypothetical protein